MANKVPIELFIIGKTEVDRVEVQRWLTFLGVESFQVPENEAAISNPALLIALAAKRCYKSFEVNEKLNPNITKIRAEWGEYLDNVLKSGHGCYDEETEVLTKKGWKFWPNVTKEDEFATLNPNGKLEWHSPKTLIRYNYSGKMYRVESQQVDLLVTPDHKMLACTTSTVEGRRREFSSYKLVQAHKLSTKPHAYLKGLSIGRREKYEHDPLFALLGFAIGDGHIDHSQLRFRLRRERKISYLRGLCGRLRIHLKEDSNQERFSIHLSDIGLGSGLFESIYSEGEKVIPQKVFDTSTTDELESLFDGLINSDGSVGKTGTVYDTTSKLLADQVQILALQIGIAANISQAECYEKRRNSFGDKPIFRLSFPSRCLKPEINKFKDMTGRSYWIEDWEGEVFCAEVPNHTLYVRRNGKPVWSGNSVLEHSVYTFAIENVSRIFTAEMNRHRAGWAISEGSLRFIRFGEGIPYWEPNSIQGLERIPNNSGTYRSLKYGHLTDIIADLHDNDMPFVRGVDQSIEGKKHACRLLMERAFDNQQLIYKCLTEIWREELAEDSTFSEKKQITSMMRRIIGLGVATGGVWTGNIRALRHVITMRCEPAAEEEILHVWSRAVFMIKEREPYLFGDFHFDEQGFWRPKYKKI